MATNLTRMTFQQEFRDVSEEVRLEEDRMKALRQNEQKSAKIKQEEFLRQNMAVFTDFLCHEVRNPLHGIAANKSESSLLLFACDDR